MKEFTALQNEKKLKVSFPFGIFKKDIVFTVSVLLAAASCFIQTPKLEYIDFKVLISLFNLMLAVKAFEEIKLLDKIAIVLLRKCQNSKTVSAILISLCFFSSMFITNDVALLTFVPLSLIVGNKAKINMTETIILQTIAANIGSSLTPMGNPQNLFIYSHYGITPGQFFSSIFSLAVFGLVSLSIFIKRLRPEPLKVELHYVYVKDSKKALLWVIVFIIIIFSIMGFISYIVAFIIGFITVCLFDIQLLKKVDYLLLITFICFFIFVGNLSNIEVVRVITSESLRNSASTFFSSIFLSQFISNVPTAILLSKFSPDWQPLLLGVNVGGLGTLIASMASVISYKLFIKKHHGENKFYLFKFSLYNFSLLVLLTIFQGLFLNIPHSI